MTTVNLLELVSFIDAGLDLVSGRKPPDAVDTESQLPALARGDVVSSMDMDFDGRVAGLKCCDVDLLSVFSARAAILSGRACGGWQEEKQEHSCLLLGCTRVSRADCCTVALSNQAGHQICTALANDARGTDFASQNCLNFFFFCVCECFLLPLKTGSRSKPRVRSSAIGHGTEGSFARVKTRLANAANSGCQRWLPTCKSWASMGSL